MLRESDGRGCPILDREGRLTAGMTFELRLKKGEKSLLCKETGQDFILGGVKRIFKGLEVYFRD